MNAKKVKQLRKIAKTLTKGIDKKYHIDSKGTITLDKFCYKSVMKELKKSFS